jgi:CRP-like cAMP-binding protein
MVDLLRQKLSEVVSRDLVAEIVRYFTPKKFPRHHVLAREGEVCGQLFFIQSGMIRTYLHGDGEQITTWVALPGTIETPARSFLRHEPSVITLETLTDCELMMLERDAYYALLSSHAGFNTFAMRLLEDFYLRMEDKFYSSLSLTAEERFLKFLRQFPEHAQKVPLKYLASILRMTPETLSRLRAKQRRNT